MEEREAQETGAGQELERKRRALGVAWNGAQEATRRRQGILRSWLPLGLVLLLGCASAPPEPSQAPAPQTVTPATPTPEPAATPPPSDRTPAEAASQRPPTTVVIEPGGGDRETTDLVAAARAERQRRQEATPPAVVIDDENLAVFAQGGRVTHSPVPTPQDGDDLDEEAVAGEGSARDEEWWRRRVRDVRLDWREAEERIGELEKRISELRYRFYAEDDPHIRDSQIKPSWDHALEALEEARAASHHAQERLDEVLAQGAEEGALPGWLREGLELEPERRAPTPAGDRGEPFGELLIIEPTVGEEEDDRR